MIEFTPAPGVISRMLNPGTFEGNVPAPPAEVLERVRSRTRAFDRLSRRQGPGPVGWIQQDRVRIWRSTFWRSHPTRGALLADLRVNDAADGRGSRVSGRLRMEPALAATGTWTAVYVAIAFVIHLPPALIVALMLVGVAQVAANVILAGRDLEPMLDLVERVLGSPASEFDDSPGG